MTPAQFINAILLSLALWLLCIWATMSVAHCGFWQALTGDVFAMGAVCVPLLWLGEE